MKETINYYYNLDIELLDNKKDSYHFKYQNVDYFFAFYNRNINEFSDIIDCNDYMVKHGIQTHQIIKNINDSFFTKVGSSNYILLKAINIYDKYDLFDICDLTNKLILNNSASQLYRNNWEKLWGDKIDYFEYQIRELAINKTVIKNSFSYYVGLAENAISYVNLANNHYLSKTTYKLSLSHRRIYYPNYSLNYFNPLSYVFDLRIRDVAEFLKSKFFSNDNSDIMEDLTSYLKISKLSIYECYMLYARLLYPSYYFDIYEDIMNNNSDEDNLLRIIDRVDDYELFLKKAYLEISKYAPLIKINWLID